MTAAGCVQREEIRARLDTIRREVAAAAGRVGRSPDAVRIVAVTKTMTPATVVAALAEGLFDIGENYVQEAAAKRRAVGPGGRWRLIGPLQRNKARLAVATFDTVDTVGGEALAAALADEAEHAGRRLPVLVQVNVSGEASKHGVAPDAVERLVQTVTARPALVLEGLMTIGRLGASPAETRRHFQTLRALRDDVASRVGVEIPHLSMGMSDDFSIAVEEGATLIRVGRALLGPRGPGSWREGQGS
jgi:pyridoxal phosphate enzyme (YggS family)